MDSGSQSLKLTYSSGVFHLNKGPISHFWKPLFLHKILISSGARTEKQKFNRIKCDVERNKCRSGIFLRRDTLPHFILYSALYFFSSSKLDLIVISLSICKLLPVNGECTDKVWSLLIEINPVHDFI